MRKGKNPAKLEGNNKVEQDCFHQIIVPVYLPKLEGYYEEGLDILKLCIESIVLTSHNKTFISIVNNGSCKVVKQYLDKCLEDKKIHEVIHTSAIGKINAIAKGLSGHNFDLVTITDADVLFTNGWQKDVYQIYKAFPKAGIVGTTPIPFLNSYLTSNINFDNFFNKKIKYVELNLLSDTNKFYNSIGYVNKENNKIKIIENRTSIKAVIGCGHFTATYRKESLSGFKKLGSTELKMGGVIMRKYIDKYIYDLDYWRLTTYYNYTYHMGNTLEDWMLAKFSDLNNLNSSMELSSLKKPRKSFFFKTQLKHYLISLIRKVF